MKGKLTLIALMIVLAIISSCKHTTEPPVMAAPVFNPPSGSYNIGQAITITCPTNGVEIRYTIDGSDPHAQSLLYVTPLIIPTIFPANTNTGTVKAKTFKEGFDPSPTVSANYTVTYANTVAMPIITPAGGTVNLDTQISIACATEEAEIRYTINGSEPNINSSLYNHTITMVSEGHVNIKVKAFKETWNPSPTTSANYTCSGVSANTVAIPILAPAGGLVNLDSQVSITCATSGAQIRYTLNGTEPNTTSTQYHDSIALGTGVEVTIKAKAFKETWNPSPVASANYTLIVPVPAMITVAGGTFNNGISDVTVSSFQISNFELTQGEYQAVMGSNPSYFGGHAYRPVEEVTWFNALEYCNRRSILEGNTPCYSYSSYGTNPDSWPSGWNTSSGNHSNVSCNWTANGYRLPTEAEWQFAARGGNQTHNYTYSGSNTIDDVAWYFSNSSSTHIVGVKLANELGLYDMSGNVWEWNWDIYGDSPGGAQTNPHGATSGSYRVRRGGSWLSDAYDCTVSGRSGDYATGSYSDIGFRVSRVFP